MTLGITDSLLGSLIGRGGAVIKELMASSGSRISVSQKGDYLPGTDQRQFKVEGLQHQVWIEIDRY